MHYLDYVDIRQGTDSANAFSRGNTLPLTGTPFAMANFCPQTKEADGEWFYHPNHTQIEGIRLTHQPSPWVGDYGHFNISVQSGIPCCKAQQRASYFERHKAVLQPHFLSVYLHRFNVLTELAPTERGACVTASFTNGETPYICFIPLDDQVSFTLDPNSRVLKGWVRAFKECEDESFTTYFEIRFSAEINLDKTLILHSDDTCEKGISGSGRGCGIGVAFTENRIEARLAISYISAEQASVNLERELMPYSFNQIRENAAVQWEKLLSKIEIEAPKDQMEIFYSSLYRMFLFPHKFHEVDPDGKTIHYSIAQRSVRPGVFYTDNGFWDTSKTVFPLYSILIPEIYAEMMEGFLNSYRESGWLPKWLSPGERGYMPGTLIDSVFADALIKGIGSHLAEEALEAMLKHANNTPPDNFHGRKGNASYLKYGYVTNDFAESVNNTLDSCYGDFCISRVMDLMDDPRAGIYKERALSYRQLFDSQAGFLRGKDCSGRFREEEFDPLVWGGDYCEGGAWQCAFGAYHDIEGMAALYGSQEKFAEKLIELFNTPAAYHIGHYGVQIHEMAEMVALELGQCAISNQPSFHIPYLFAELKRPSLTQYIIRRILTEHFTKESFPGDEDNGSMAGFYIFSALGFYPVCPSIPQYTIGSPMFKKAVIHLPDGNVFILKSKHFYESNVFVSSMKLNGVPYSRNYIEHEKIMAGGLLEFELSCLPSTERWI